MSEKPRLVVVDYHNPEQTADLITILNTYASEPVGGNEPLPESVKKNLPEALANEQGAVSFLVYINKQPVALANCLRSFSTFYCKPILNIHDFIVMPAFRKQGLSQLLLSAIEDHAVTGGYCKITLEVLSKNKAAKAAYMKSGFNTYTLESEYGVAEFWQKLV